MAVAVPVAVWLLLQHLLFLFRVLLHVLVFHALPKSCCKLIQGLPCFEASTNLAPTSMTLSRSARSEIWVGHKKNGCRHFLPRRARGVLHVPFSSATVRKDLAPLISSAAKRLLSVTAVVIWPGIWRPIIPSTCRRRMQSRRACIQSSEFLLLPAGRESSQCSGSKGTS